MTTRRIQPHGTYSVHVNVPKDVMQFLKAKIGDRLSFETKGKKVILTKGASK
jgi:antitoxin component of MazEF toxin-antitoxin module